MADHDGGATEDETTGFFQFQPRTLGSLFSSNGSTRIKKLIPQSSCCTNSHKLNRFKENSYSFPCNNIRYKETSSAEDAGSMVEVAETLSEPGSSFSHSPEPDNENAVSTSRQCECHTNNQLGNPPPDLSIHTESSGESSTKARTSESDGSCQAPEKSNTSCQNKNGDNLEAPKTESRPKILLVEDNKINVMVTQSMMRQLGHSIDVVNNGVEAVQAVQRHGYDLILMDVCMPVMDGLKAIRLIRSFEETGDWDAAVKAGIELCSPSSDSPQYAQDEMPLRKRIPIIAMTANALSESAEECSANGMDSFVSKPVTFQKLKECLDQYLS